LTGLNGDITPRVQSVLTLPGMMSPDTHHFISVLAVVGGFLFGVPVAVIIMFGLAMMNMALMLIAIVLTGFCLARRIVGRAFISGRS